MISLVLSWPVYRWAAGCHLASGGFPISAHPLRLGELVATLALAQDNAFGQPFDSQLRSCLLAMAMCRDANFDEELHRTVYWVALLRYVGCTGHAHEVSSVFGDDLAILAETLVMDAGDPADVGRTMVAAATAGHPPAEHPAITQALLAGAHAWAVHNFSTGCEVGDMLIQRLDLGPDVRAAFGFTYERWNGNGYPTHAKGEQIPLAMRIVHLTHDMEAIGRRSSPVAAIEAARDRRDRTYDPDLADLFVAHGSRWFAEVDRMDPWEAVLGLEPDPRRTLDGAGLDAALTVAADFIDLKSPYRAGHSRRCAQLGADAGRVYGATEQEIAALRWAAYLHEFGTTAIPNSILDKRGPLTRAEFDRVQLHPRRSEPARRRASRKSRRVRLSQGTAGGCHRSRRSPAGRGGRLRRTHDRAK